HDGGLAPFLAELVCHDSRKRIGGRAGYGRNHDLHRSGRIWLLRRARRRPQRDARHGHDADQTGETGHSLLQLHGRGPIVLIRGGCAKPRLGIGRERIGTEREPWLTRSMNSAPRAARCSKQRRWAMLCRRSPIGSRGFYPIPPLSPRPSATICRRDGGGSTTIPRPVSTCSRTCRKEKTPASRATQPP